MKQITEFILNKILRLHADEKTINQCFQFIQFGIVGVSNTLISYVVYVILVAGDVNYLLASVIGFCVSVANSFYWNNKYVFKQQGTEKRSLMKAFLKTFLAYAGTGLVLNNILLVFWIQFIHLHELLAPIVNLLITIPLNFILNKFWAFRKE